MSSTTPRASDNHSAASSTSTFATTSDSYDSQSRAPNSYMLFRSFRWETLKKQGAAPQPQDKLSARLSKEWHALDAERRRHWDAVAAHVKPLWQKYPDAECVWLRTTAEARMRREEAGVGEVEDVDEVPPTLRKKRRRTKKKSASRKSSAKARSATDSSTSDTLSSSSTQSSPWASQSSTPSHSDAAGPSPRVEAFATADMLITPPASLPLTTPTPNHVSFSHINLGRPIAPRPCPTQPRTNLLSRAGGQHWPAAYPAAPMQLSRTSRVTEYTPYLNGYRAWRAVRLAARTEQFAPTANHATTSGHQQRGAQANWTRSGHMLAGQNSASAEASTSCAAPQSHQNPPHSNSYAAARSTLQQHWGGSTSNTGAANSGMLAESYGAPAEYLNESDCHAGPSDRRLYADRDNISLSANDIDWNESTMSMGADPSVHPPALANATDARHPTEMSYRRNVSYLNDGNYWANATKATNPNAGAYLSPVNFQSAQFLGSSAPTQTMMTAMPSMTEMSAAPEAQQAPLSFAPAADDQHGANYATLGPSQTGYATPYRSTGNDSSMNVPASGITLDWSASAYPTDTYTDASAGSSSNIFPRSFAEPPPSLDVLEALSFVNPFLDSQLRVRRAVESELRELGREAVLRGGFQCS
ncbi:hypothetical protein HDZ31DRAFT_69771 [Schizophyllum fasciatum]